MSSKSNERLDRTEEKMFRDGICPDCRERRLVMGQPEARCIKYTCMNEKCGTRFSDLGLFGVERISDAFPNYKPPTENS